MHWPCITVIRALGATLPSCRARSLLAARHSARSSKLAPALLAHRMPVSCHVALRAMTDVNPTSSLTSLCKAVASAGGSSSADQALIDCDGRSWPRITRDNFMQHKYPSLRQSKNRGPSSPAWCWFVQMSGQQAWDGDSGSTSEWVKMKKRWDGWNGGNAARVESRGERSADDLRVHAALERLRQQLREDAARAQAEEDEIVRRFKRRLESGTPPTRSGTDAELQFRLRAPHDLSVPLHPDDFNDIVIFASDAAEEDDPPLHKREGRTLYDFTVEGVLDVWPEWDAFNLWVAKRLRWSQKEGPYVGTASGPSYGYDWRPTPHLIWQLEEQLRADAAIGLVDTTLFYVGKMPSRGDDGASERCGGWSNVPSQLFEDRDLPPQERIEPSPLDYGPPPSMYLELMHRWKASPERREWYYDHEVELCFVDGEIANELHDPRWGHTPLRSASPQAQLEATLQDNHNMRVQSAAFRRAKLRGNVPPRSALLLEDQDWSRRWNEEEKRRRSESDCVRAWCLWRTSIAPARWPLLYSLDDRPYVHRRCSSGWYGWDTERCWSLGYPRPTCSQFLPRPDLTASSERRYPHDGKRYSIIEDFTMRAQRHGHDAEAHIAKEVEIAKECRENRKFKLLSLLSDDSKRGRLTMEQDGIESRRIEPQDCIQDCIHREVHCDSYCFDCWNASPHIDMTQRRARAMTVCCTHANYDRDTKQPHVKLEHIMERGDW